MTSVTLSGSVSKSVLTSLARRAIATNGSHQKWSANASRTEFFRSEGPRGPICLFSSSWIASPTNPVSPAFRRSTSEGYSTPSWLASW